MLNDPAKDPKRQPGVYLKLGHAGNQRLYEVLGYDRGTGDTRVLNVATLHLVHLSHANILQAEIVEPELDEETAKQMAPFELAAAAVKSPEDSPAPFSGPVSAPQIESD